LHKKRNYILKRAIREELSEVIGPAAEEEESLFLILVVFGLIELWMSWRRRCSPPAFGAR
jgi:hypothetical protein